MAKIKTYKLNKRFDKNQPRDENGRWTSGSGEGGKIDKKDITVGAKFKIKTGDVFTIDSMEESKEFGTLVRTKLNDAKFSNYMDSIEEAIAFYNDEGAKIFKKRSSMSLDQRINEMKTRSGHIAYRSLEVNQNGVLVGADLDNRIIKGYLCKWGNKNKHGEKFIKGCVTKSLNERGPGSQAKYKITFLWMHDETDPLAVFTKLVEDDYGLYFETAPLDDVPNGDRCLKQIRSGTLNQFSIGFYYNWDKIEYDEADDSMLLLEIDMMEGSVVAFGSDDQTYAIRSGRITADQIHDDIDDFINTLPRKNRLEARKLFTLQKTLVTTEKTQHEELSKRKPSAKKVKTRKINLNYLTEKL
jgi:HK97 family phage prohead protease